jgi:hypothetical protein
MRAMTSSETPFARSAEVVTRVSPAADQTDEFWILGQHGLQRLDEVSRVVVGVHDVDVVAKGVWQIY